MKDKGSFYLFTLAFAIIFGCIINCDGSKKDDVLDYGFNYHVIRLNDSTFLLNPTSNNRLASPKIILKDSLDNYIINDNHIQ